MYLLDTNVVSDILSNPRGLAAGKRQQAPDEDVAVSIVVACELRFGAQKRKSAALKELIEGFLSRTPVLPFEELADHNYAQLRWDLERAGTPIGANDMLTAAHALALGATLVTDNTRNFPVSKD